MKKQDLTERTGLLFLKHILRKIFLEDWATKVVALAITLALWLGVTGLSTPTTRRITNIPLSLSYSNNTEITDSSAQAVDLVISGDKRSINQITERDLLVSVDLSDLPPGERVVELDPRNVLNLPLGVKVQEIQPSKVQVKLEGIESKEVPVNVETKGDLPDGFELYDRSVTPSVVHVKGPSSFVRSISSISTEKIELSEHRGDFVARQIPLVSDMKATLAETAVDVSFRIGEKRISRSFTLPIEDNPGRHASVTLYAGRSLLTSITPANIKVTLEKGSNKPHVSLDEGFQAAQIKNVRVL